MEGNSNCFSSCHLDLWSVAIIGRVEDDHFFSFVYQSHEGTEQTFNATSHGDDVGL
jgi:hypothetical protein